MTGVVRGVDDETGRSRVLETAPPLIATVPDELAGESADW
jgi:hypothetical protein